VSGEVLLLAALVVRAEEAWEPVLLGGLIPILGAAAIAYIIYRAVREDEEQEDNQDRDR
jgi:hypothetical protein